MSHSEKCPDPTTFYNRSACVTCAFKPGHEVTLNCGRDDHGGVHEDPFRPCQRNWFNDGSRALCRPCASCPRGHTVTSNCSSTADTQCEEPRSWSRFPVEREQEPSVTSVRPPGSVLMWAVPLSIVICILLLFLSAYVVYVRWKKGVNAGRQPVMFFGSSLDEEGFSPLSVPAGSSSSSSGGVLSQDILSAPLQTVLDNLDVLEELVILLDPESQAVKNTKHLASHCSFPSTWITYTYSMKDIKSPLKAVLEGVTSKHPDWTVGHLVELLGKMERNDAIVVLGQLKLNNTVVYMTSEM